MKRAVLSVLAAVPLVAFASAAALSAQARTELTAKLWPRDRIEIALAALDEQRSAGLLGEVAYERRREMLFARLEGTFTPTMLAVRDPRDLIQNGSFEAIDRNTSPDRSRWHWWQGWRWEGEYEMRWEDRGRHVRSGRYSARITSAGTPGRVALFTPILPRLGETRRYRFHLWAKGSGENELLASFEAGASGSVRKRLGREWERIEVRGLTRPGATGFRVYLNSMGTGTIWLDDASLTPETRP